MREIRLVALGFGQFVQHVIGFFAEAIAPLLEDRARRFRGRHAAHALTRQQRQRGGHRQLVAARHAGETLGLAGFGETRLQIGGDAGHVAGAEHFDAGLFQGIVDGPGVALGG